MDSQNTEKINVIGDFNVNTVKSHPQKQRIHLKILGAPDLKVGQVDGIVQKEKIPPLKSIIIQAGRQT